MTVVFQMKIKAMSTSLNNRQSVKTPQPRALPIEQKTESTPTPALRMPAAVVVACNKALESFLKARCYIIKENYSEDLPKRPPL